MLINLTKHDIYVYNLADVHMARNNPGVCRIKNKFAVPKTIPEFARPFGIHYYPVNDFSIAVEDVNVNGSLNHCSSLDFLPQSINYEEDIVIVSGIYAEVAKSHLIQQPEILDALFVPADKVLNASNKNIGCTGLRKVGNYFSPSYYSRCRGNKYSRQLAIKYWTANRNFLNVYEQNCLATLQQQQSIL